jgi:hypothetical protein
MSSSENEAWRDEMNPHSLLPKKKRSSIAQQTKKKKGSIFGGFNQSNFERNPVFYGLFDSFGA